MKANWNHLKEVADNLGADLNAEAAWERFEQRREKKKRRIIFWWPYGVVGGILLFGITIFTNSKLTTNNNISSNDLKENSNVVQKNEGYMNLLDETTKTSIVLDKIDRYQENSNDKTNISTNQNNPKTDENISQAASFVINQKSPSYEAPVIHHLISNKPQLHNTSIALFEKNHIPRYDKNDHSSRTPKILNRSAGHENDSVNKKSNSLLQEYTKEPMFSIKPILTTTNIYYQSPKLSIEDYIQPATPIDNFKRNKNNMTFRVRYIYGFTKRSLTSDDLFFKERREIHEDFKESNAIEFLLSKKLTPIISLSAGVGVHQYRAQLFEVTQELIQNVSFSNVLLERRTKEGVTEEIRGNFVGSQTVITERIRTQKYRGIGLPIYLNLDLPIFSKVNLSLSTGANFSLVNSVHGVTFLSKDSQGVYQQLNNLNYRKRGLIQGLVNVEFSIELTPSIDVHAGAQLRYDLNNRINSTNSVSDKFRSYGALIGIGKRF